MTKKQRIADLEARVAALEAKFAGTNAEITTLPSMQYTIDPTLVVDCPSDWPGYNAITTAEASRKP